MSVRKPQCPRSMRKNYLWCEGKKANSLAVEEFDYIFVSATTGFCASFLRYHDALQFRGYVSSKAIAWAQLTSLWPDDHSHQRFNQDYGLLFHVIAEFKDMWKLHSRKDKERLLRSIEIDNPLQLASSDWVHFGVVLKLVSELLPLYKNYWTIDKFHARGHGPDCKCSLLNHKRLERRLKEVNTSISWFRGYSSTFSSMNPNVQLFYVLAYARRRNAMEADGGIEHQNPWPAHKQAMKKAAAWKKPASHSYNCKAVAKTHVKKKPAAAARDSVVSGFFNFLHSGRSGYVLLCGFALLVLAGVMMVATFDSREARAAPPGWERFVAATSSNQWVSCAFLLSAASIVLSINYLPRLEGEG
ncbi:unnamed protein product [Durusdinium trenchii]|uniref:Uncharacterized protein n=1 Tax=Durusdinium trenchii TaxID=1381693 RepID=A0ABP0P1L7_9DINO